MIEINPYEELASSKPVENEYDSLVKQNQEESINNSVYIAKDKSPDEHAKVLGLSNQIGAQSSFVEENFNSLNKSREENNLKSTINQSAQVNPKTTEFVSNPDNLSVSKDDLDTLYKLEQDFNDHNYFSQASNALLGGLARGYANLAQAPAAIGNVSLIPSNIVRKSLGLDQVSYNVDNQVSEYYNKASEAFFEKAPEQSGSIVDQVLKGNFEQAGRTVGLQFLANTPNQLMILLGAATGNPAAGLAVAGVTSMAGKASELQQQGIEPLSAAPVSVANGMIEAAFEQLGTASWVNKWVNSLSTNFGAQTTKEVLFNFSKTVFANIYQEAAEEFTTSLAQDFTDYISGVDDKAMEGSFMRALDAGAVGGFSGGALTAPIGISVGMAKRSQIKQAETNKELFNRLSDNHDNSKLRVRLPERYEAFVDTLTKDGPVENVYFSTEGFNTFFQSKDLNPVQVANELGISEQYNKAIETGTDIEVKTSYIAANMANKENFQGLSDHIRFRPDDLTVSEAKQVEAEENTRLQEQWDEAKKGKTEEQIKSYEDSAVQVGKEIKAQLVDQQGYNAKSATQAATLWQEYFKVMGTKTNIDPMELYKKYGVKIQSEKYSDFVMSKPQLINVESEGNELVSKQIVKDLSQDFTYVQNNGNHSLSRIDSNDSVNFTLEDNVVKLKDINVSDVESLVSFVKAVGNIASSKNTQAIIPKESVTKLNQLNIPLPILQENLFNNGFEYLEDTDGNLVLNKLVSLYQKTEDYQMEHRPPDSTSGAPAHDLTSNNNAIYPEDFYSDKAKQYYGTGDSQSDSESIYVLQSIRNKPNAKVKIYRAVPVFEKGKISERKQLLNLYNYFQKYKFFPVNYKIVNELEKKYENENINYEEKQNAILNDISNKIDQLSQETKQANNIKINSGDWVSLSRSYAKQHGESALDGNYRIITKTVPAKTLFTNGDSVNEFGYWVNGIDPSSQQTEGKTVLFQTKKPSPPETNQLGFYSQLENEILKMDFKQAPATDLWNRIKNIEGLKKEEIEYIGLEEFLKAKENEKISKDELVSFIQSKGLVVDQKVLGEMPKPKSGVDTKNQWGQKAEFAEESEPNWDMISNIAYEEWKDFKRSSYIQQESRFFQEEYILVKKEAEDNLEEGEELDEEDLIDQTLNNIEDEWIKNEEDSLADSDSYNTYTITETNSGKSMYKEGSDGEWYNGEGDRFGYYDNEAKIKFESWLRDNEYLEPFINKPRAQDIEFQKDEDVLDEDLYDELENKVKETEAYKKRYKESFDKFKQRPDLSEDELLRAIDRDLKSYVEDEIDNYADPNDSRVSKRYRILNEQISLYDFDFEMDLTGNPTKGWEVEFITSISRNKTFDLSPMDLESAKKKVLEYLDEKDYLVKEDEVTQEQTGKYDKLNAPSAPSKWKSHSVFGGERDSNYKELLLRLPNIGDKKFKYTTHFDDSNIVAHARISEIQIDNKKTLFIEEIQSDWHQQARDKGYFTEKDRKELSSLKEELKTNEDKFKSDSNQFEDNTRLSLYIKVIFSNNFNKKLSSKIATVKEINEKVNEKLTEDEIKKIEALYTLYQDTQLLVNKIHIIENMVPDVPFKQTDAWSSLIMKRILHYAHENNFEKIAIVPSGVQTKRWGTDSVSWVKKEDENGIYWIVGAAEQVGGLVDGINLEEAARARNVLLERKGVTTRTKEELSSIIKEILHRERSEKALNNLTNRVWDLMNSEVESGGLKPREEGMRFFYDKLLPDVTKKLFKKLDKTSVGQKVDLSEVTKQGGKETLVFDLTPKAQEKIAEGFSLFQEKRGAISFSKNRQFKISLFEEKNESTFLHESAHFFFEVLADIATGPTATDQIREDYQTILDWMGAADRTQVTTDMHENFARGFESYLMTGKAPSSKLRKAFAAFKNWLVSIYKDAVNLDVNVSPEVKEVFDRLLATDQQLSLAQEKIGPRYMFGDPTLIGMTEKESKEYLETVMAAQEDANDEIRARVMRDLLKKKDKAYKETYEKIYNAELEKAKKLPQFQAIDFIQNEGKLSKPVIEQYYSPFKDYLPFRSTQVEGGLHPDTVANIFGYENGQAMLQDIAPFRRGVEDYADRETATQMRQNYPDVLTSPELSEEAIRAYHNDNAAKVKAIEMEFLIKNDPKIQKKVAAKLIRRLPTARKIQDKAKNIVANTKISELKPHVFRNAEKKYANEAAKAYKKGDYEKAFQNKNLEYLNFELYRASVDAKEDVKNSIGGFKKMFRNIEDVSNTRDVDLVNAAKGVLAKFGLARSEKEIDDYLQKLKAYDPETYSVVNALVLNATRNAKDYNQISYNDFVEMKDAVNAIWDLSKNRKELQLEGKKIGIDEAINTLVEQINKITPQEKNDYDQTVTKFGMVKEKILGAKASLVRAEAWSKAVDVVENGPFWSMIYRPISDAITKYRLEKINVFNKYKDLVEKYNPNITFDKINSDELKFIFKDKTELIGAILHTGNESNKRKLLVGRGWATINDDNSLNTKNWDSFINRMHQEGIIKKVDMDFVQNIWDLLETLKPEAQKSHKQQYGYYFNEITAQDVVTPFGTYRGGYVPAKADVYSNEDAAIRREREEFENNNNSFQFPTTGRGFTKSRVDNYNVPLTLDLGMLASHIDGVLRFTYVNPRVKEVSRIILDRGFRSELAKLDTNIAKDMLVPWLQRSAQQKVLLPSQDGLGRLTDAAAKVLRKNVAMQIMFGNISNSLQQITGLVVAMSKVKPRYIKNGLAKYVLNNKESIETIMNKSDWMKANQGENIFDISKNIDEILLNPSSFEKFQSFTKQHTYFLQSAAQNLVNNIVWMGAYEQAVEQKMTEDQAIKNADSAVRLTQGTTNAEDISRFETGTATEMLFKQFVSYFNMIANLNASEILKIHREFGLKKGAGKAFYVYMMAFALPAIFSDLIMKAMGGKFDEDDDESYVDDLLLSFFGSQFKTLFAMIPYVGQAGNAIYNRMFTKTLADDKLSLSPVISIIESTVVAPVSVYESIKENKDLKKKTVKDMLQLMGIMSGLPLGPLGKPIGYQMDVEAGKANPENLVDYTRGLVTGKSGQ